MDVKLNNCRPTLAMVLKVLTSDSVWLEELFPKAPARTVEIQCPSKVPFELSVSGEDLVLTFVGSRPHVVIHKLLKFNREIEKIVMSKTELVIFIENFPDITLPIES